MDMKFLDKKHAEKLKKKLTEELEEYINYVRYLPDNQMIESNHEISKKNQIFEHVISSLDKYDSSQIRAMLSTPGLLDTLYKKVIKEESNPHAIITPIEDAIEEMTFNYLYKIRDKKDKRPTWFDRITGLAELVDEDEYDYYDDLDSGYFSIPVKDYHLPKDSKRNTTPKNRLKDILNNVDKVDVITSEELMSLEDTIDLLISFKKHENQQNHEMNKQLNKVLPKLKRMQYQKKFDEEEKQINHHIRNERIR